MAGLRIYTVTNTEGSILIANGFKLVRDCGTGTLSFMISFTVSLIDNLILARKTCYSNYQFVDKS